MAATTNAAASTPGWPYVTGFAMICAEAAGLDARDARDRRSRDHEDGGGPDPREKKRQAERQLDTRDDLSLGQPHPPRRLDDVPVDAVHGEIGVRQDRRDPEHDECRGDVPEADAEPRDEETDERDGRQRAADRGHAQRKE